MEGLSRRPPPFFVLPLILKCLPCLGMLTHGGDGHDVDYDDVKIVYIIAISDYDYYCCCGSVF